MMYQTHCREIKPIVFVEMLLLATSFLLLSTAAADTTTMGKTSTSINQLRGGNNKNKNHRSMQDLALILTEDDNYHQKQRPIRLPVAPGIADGVNEEELPCLVRAICEQPQLSILCGFTTTHLREWYASDSGNFFVNEDAGTFFAPMDEAFEDSGYSLMSTILSKDLADAGILENVLLNHAVPIDTTIVDIDDDSNVTNTNRTEDLLWSIDDFVCNEDLVMANGQETSTLCFGDTTRNQVGSGNLPMRTLPKIVTAEEGGIEACDGTVAMHMVNNLILPPLPLKGVTRPLECPPSRPDFSDTCAGHPVGQTCDYGHMYLGCTCDDLHCAPITSCSCEADGSWACMMMSVAQCGSFDVRGEWIEDIPEGLPWGESCDPEEELPICAPTVISGESETGNNGSTSGSTGDNGNKDDSKVSDALFDGTNDSTNPEVIIGPGDGSASMEVIIGPGDTNDSVVSRRPSDVCPPSPSFDTCTGYLSGLQCNYNHIYSGCSWDEPLECLPTEQCECDKFGDARWACRVDSRLPCASPRPEGHPGGQECDPNRPLPLPPTPSTETVAEEKSSEVMTEIARGGMP